MSVDLVAQFRQRFAAAEQPQPITRATPNPPQERTVPSPQDAGCFDALEAMPGYWHGRALGRLQATDAMDLTRDSLADHQAVAEYERRSMLATIKGAAA